MSTKKCSTIQKRAIDLQFYPWFTLGIEYEDKQGNISPAVCAMQNFEVSRLMAGFVFRAQRKKGLD